jgi:pilus assembly protein Flp/PilA
MGPTKEKLMLTLIANAQSCRFCLAGRAASLLDDRGGATAIEYGLIAAGIAIAIIAAVFAIGDELDAFFGGIQTQLNAKQPG